MLRALILPALMIAAPVAAATTIQQDFDAAQALLDAGKAAEASTAFAALLTRFPPGSQGKAASLVRARLGSAMMATGDSEAAEAMLVAALPGFKGATPQDAEERGVAAYDLGRARESLGRLDSAAVSYRAALASGGFAKDGFNDIGARAALARTLIWSHPGEARTLLDALLALPPESFGKNKDQRALLETLRGRVELNAGDAGAAKRWFTTAARTAGGAETRSVSIADVRIRGDLALASYQLGKMDEVQKFIAFSGAGGLASEGLGAAANTPLPPCAPVTGLAPDAVAVVEFAIGSDGRVTSVTPIYASRGSGAAVAGASDDGPEVLFPEAVRRWFWNPERVAKLDPFWRQSIRVELRCMTDRGGGSPIWQSFNAEFIRWENTAGVKDFDGIDRNDVTALPVLRAEIARRERVSGAQSLQLIDPLMLLLRNEAAPEAERDAARKRRTALIAGSGAPLPVIVFTRLGDIETESQAGKNRGERARFARDALLPLLAEQEAAGQGETRIAMFTRLQLAEAQDNLRATAASAALLQHIVAAPETLLAAGDPIRTAALLRLANQAAAAKDIAAAASTLAATGLSPEQCALVDIRPQAVNASIGSSAFPDEARRWHSGGYVRVGYDITAAGKPVNVRTIVASPPFTFGPATEKAVARFEYRPVFRPGNELGCTGTTQGVRYIVP